MLAGVNDRYEQALALAKLVDRRIYKVNLIPYNPTGMDEGSSRAAIDTFRAVLEEHGLRATGRLTRGDDSDAAPATLAAKACRCPASSAARARPCSSSTPGSPTAACGRRSPSGSPP